MGELGELFGESAAIAAVRDTLRRLLDRARASHRLPSILLQGDTGAGKGLVAHLLHRLGPRSQAPFIDVNCAALPLPLLEAELFGFVRGAFTDARHPKPGLFHAAHGGVLFLDEIALLPEPVQAKLLTALEDRAVRRLGATRPEPADVWVVSASNTDLKAAVAARRFREDLYHRLAVVTIELPPLRDRGRDILLLAQRFLARACTEYSVAPKCFDAGAEARLLGYSWPGNIRELGNVIERAALLADSPVIGADELGLLPEHYGEVVTAEVPVNCVNADARPFVLQESLEGRNTSRSEAQRQHLLDALEQTGWNISLAAARLGIARNTVYARLAKFGLRAAHPREAVEIPSPAVEPAPERESVVVSPAFETELLWEQRRLALLRADVAVSGETNSWSRASRTLDVIVAKVHSFGGRIEELTPTSLVAVFGLEPTEDFPRRAAHAALSISRSMQRDHEPGRTAFDAIVAMHAAMLSIAHIGSRVELDAHAKRAPWEMLERLRHVAVAGAPLVSAAMAPYLERRFELVPVEETLAGQDPAYRLTGGERRGLDLWGAMTPLVGRRDELVFLRDRLSMAVTDRGQLVAVIGEAGVGKSRLIFEFAQEQRKAGRRILEGYAVSHGRAMSYLPVAMLLKDNFGIQDHDDAGSIYAKVNGAVRSLDRELEPTIPALLALLDASADDAPWQTLSAPERRRRMHDAVRRLLLRQAREQPLVVILEDLHWIDGETQTLLDELVAALSSARVLLLVSFRPEYRHAWGVGASDNQLRLDILPADLARKFLDILLGTDCGLEPVKQLLVERGNPFFLEETVRALVEMRALGGQRGDYRLLRPVQTVAVPATVHAVLAARIDRLVAAEKQLLHMASAIGTNVPLRLLLAVAGTEDEGALRRSLARLCDAGFLREMEVNTEVEYTFEHVLTHEVAYAALRPESRRHLHARIVDAIEVLYRDRLGEQVEHLAHHAVRGDLRHRAVLYLRKAANKAAARSALQTAREWFEQALSVLNTLPRDQPTLEEAFEIRLELRPLLVHLGEVRAALAHLREAEGVAEKLNDEGRLGRVCAVVSNAHSLLGELNEALSAGTRALDIAKHQGDEKLRILATVYLEQAHFHRGEFEAVVALATANIAALPAAWAWESFGAAIPISLYDRYRLLQALASLGRFAEAARYEEEVLRLSESTQYAVTVGMVCDAAGRVHVLKGNWARARALIEQAIAAYRSADSHLTLPPAIAASAWILAEMGQQRDALIRLQEAAELSEREQNAVQLTPIFHALARAALRLGRLEDARRFSACALRYTSSHVGYAPHVPLLLGDIEAGSKPFDAERAAAHYRDGLAASESLGMRPLTAHCHLGLAKLYRRIDERDEALTHLAVATELYRVMDMTYWLARAQTELNGRAPSPSPRRAWCC
jgi:DNA-binding NtrC family response regulator/tetratricopeptide (TPR) repeat protein